MRRDSAFFSPACDKSSEHVWFLFWRQRLFCLSLMCSPDLLFHFHLLYFFACGRKNRSEQLNR